MPCAFRRLQSQGQPSATAGSRRSIKDVTVTQATRAAERNNFTHHRANLMFSGYPNTNRRLDLLWSATVLEGAETSGGEALATPRRQLHAGDGPAGM